MSHVGVQRAASVRDWTPLPRSSGQPLTQHSLGHCVNALFFVPRILGGRRRNGQGTPRGRHLWHIALMLNIQPSIEIRRMANALALGDWSHDDEQA